ncbi:MAG: hypothetical protein AAGA08_13450 [Pseudomonadota bacterium]
MQVSKHNVLALCVAVSLGTAAAGIAQSDEHNDGAAAKFGAAQLNSWKKDPATPAKIARVTRAKTDMAVQLSLSPGQYSWAELAQIAAAGSDQSAQIVTFMKIEGARPMAAAHTSQGEQALAAGLGVSAKDYTLNQLAKMKFGNDS